jgi:flagellar protein FliO/FliZ
MMSKAIDTSQWLSLIASFAMVLVLLLGTLWVLRRIGAAGLRPQAGRRLVVVESLWLGNRQRVVLLRVDSREVLLGISNQGITRLDGAVEARAASPDAIALREEGAPETAAAEPAPAPADAKQRFLDAMRSMTSRSSGEGR